MPVAIQVFPMFYTYVLTSINGSHRYIGHTQNLSLRLSYHNSGKVRSTKAFKPWKIAHYEKFETCDEAIQREKYSAI
jgi:putative endonuclease